jgi:hypothetical protein
MMPAPPREEVKVRDLVRQYWEIQHKTYGQPWEIPNVFGISISTTTVMLFITLILIYVFRHRIGHMFRRAVMERPPGGHDPLPREEQRQDVGAGNPPAYADEQRLAEQGDKKISRLAFVLDEIAGKEEEEKQILV